MLNWVAINTLCIGRFIKLIQIFNKQKSHRNRKCKHWSWAWACSCSSATVLGKLCCVTGIEGRNVLASWSLVTCHSFSLHWDIGHSQATDCILIRRQTPCSKLKFNILLRAQWWLTSSITLHDYGKNRNTWLFPLTLQLQLSHLDELTLTAATACHVFM